MNVARTVGRWHVALALGLGAAVLAGGAAGLGAQQIPLGGVGHNVEVVGYTDVNGNIPFKMALQQVGDRWYMYTGSFWVSGWSIIDVTDPTAPTVARFVAGPERTSTIQMDFAEGRMLTPLSRQGGGGTGAPQGEGGFYLWDIRDPLSPQRLGYWRANGTHRNYYDGGRYVHATAAMEGYDGQIYVIVDVQDPANPVEAGRWWVKGQHTAGGETLTETGVSLHGPPTPIGNLVYLPYGSAGMIILDISDVTKPREVGRLDFSPPFGPRIASHSVVPLPDRGIALHTSEAIAENCEEPLNSTAIVDISDPAKPFLVSVFPRPVPPPGSPFSDFCDKGGRFGPHNFNQLQHTKAVEKQGDLVYLSYFNAGLRIFDISNVRAPREVGYFVPPDPLKRYGSSPRTRLVLRTEDVLVDTRGYIYITDRNWGIWVLRYTGPRPSTNH